MNKLYYGDNLEILRKYVGDESVDLVYLDPPFNSQRAYNVIFQDKTGKASTAQIRAFEDTWTWTPDTQEAYDQIITRPTVSHELKAMIQAYRSFLDRSDLMAYLTMMAIRLVELHRVLKPTGSLYLHCDPTASHYLKILLDQIFGVSNYRNEIIWKRTSGHSDRKGCGNTHDILLLYSKTTEFLWNDQHQEYSSDYIQSHFKKDDNGRVFQDYDLTAGGLSGGGYEYAWKGVKRVWRCPLETMKKYEAEQRLYYTSSKLARYKRFLDELPGVPLQDIWSDIPPVNPASKERIGYQTQKPLALLERIIASSSDENSLVLDPFCGCGTAIVAAEKLGRNWIGIDITHLAISLIKKRVTDHFPDAKYEVVGEPKSADAAEMLFIESAFQFESWAVSLIGGQPFKSTGGGDTGIDGLLYFQDYEKNFHRIIIEVKGGGYHPKDIRALKAVMDRESSPMGILIALKPPTKGMLSEAAAMGKWHMPGSRQSYPVLQVFTIQDFFDGKRPQLPDTSETLKRAPRQHRDKDKKRQQKLL